MMKNDQENVRVAFYIRVSTSEQIKGFSLEMQEKELNEHVQRKAYRGWHTKPEWIFTEQASAANIERNELKRLMDMAKQKEFDLILVWKIDRISRSLSDLLKISEALKGYEVGFASLKEDIDFSGPIGQLIFQIFGALAEFERETIKMRTTEGKNMSALLGNYIGGSVPYGYEKIKNKGGKGSKLKLVKKEGEIVKQIFDWFVYDKFSLSQIAKQLNEMGISKAISATKRVKHTKWNDNSIKTIIKNDIYRGLYIVNRFRVVSKKPKRYEENPRKEWIITNVEGVINDILFLSAQNRLEHGKKGKRGGGKKKYMLAGKLVDVVTGKGFVGYPSAKGTKNYRRKKFVDKNGQVFKTISISANQLEGQIWNVIEKAILQPKLFLEIHKKNQSNFKKQEALQSKLHIYEEAYSRSNKRIEKVNLDYYDGNIEIEDKKQTLLAFENQRDENFKKAEAIKAQLLQLSQYDVACNDLNRFSESLKKGVKSFTYQQKKDLVEMLVEKIEIHEEEDRRIVKPYFRFDQKAVSSAMPGGRTNLVHKVNKNSISDEKMLFNGGRCRSRTYDILGVNQTL